MFSLSSSLFWLFNRPLLRERIVVGGPAPNGPLSPTVTVWSVPMTLGNEKRAAGNKRLAVVIVVAPSGRAYLRRFFVRKRSVRPPLILVLMMASARFVCTQDATLASSSEMFLSLIPAGHSYVPCHPYWLPPVLVFVSL